MTELIEQLVKLVQDNLQFAIIVASVIIIAMTFSLAVIFFKIRVKSWKALIPVYNIVVLINELEIPSWMFLTMVIPFVNFIGIPFMIILIGWKLGKLCRKGIFMRLGLIILPPLFYPLLSATYIDIDGLGRDYGEVVKVKNDFKMEAVDIGELNVPITAMSLEGEQAIETIAPILETRNFAESLKTRDELKNKDFNAVASTSSANEVEDLTKVLPTADDLTFDYNSLYKEAEKKKEEEQVPEETPNMEIKQVGNDGASSTIDYNELYKDTIKEEPEEVKEETPVVEEEKEEEPAIVIHEVALEAAEPITESLGPILINSRDNNQVENKKVKKKQVATIKKVADINAETVVEEKGKVEEPVSPAGEENVPLPNPFEEEVNEEIIENIEEPSVMEVENPIEVPTINIPTPEPVEEINPLTPPVMENIVPVDTPIPEVTEAVPEPVLEPSVIAEPVPEVIPPVEEVILPEPVAPEIPVAQELEIPVAPAAIPSTPVVEVPTIETPVLEPIPEIITEQVPEEIVQDPVLDTVIEPSTSIESVVAQAPLDLPMQAASPFGEDGLPILADFPDLSLPEVPEIPESNLDAIPEINLTEIAMQGMRSNQVIEPGTRQDQIISMNIAEPDQLPVGVLVKPVEEKKEIPMPQPAPVQMPQATMTRDEAMGLKHNFFGDNQAPSMNQSMNYNAQPMNNMGYPQPTINQPMNYGNPMMNNNAPMNYNQPPNMGYNPYPQQNMNYNAQPMNNMGYPQPTMNQPMNYGNPMMNNGGQPDLTSIFQSNPQNGGPLLRPVDNHSVPTEKNCPVCGVKLRQDCPICIICGYRF